MADSMTTSTFHSTKWWTEPSRQVRATRTRFLPCVWCTSSGMTTTRVT